jgi:hypothetical protein
LVVTKTGPDTSNPGAAENFLVRSTKWFWVLDTVHGGVPTVPHHEIQTAHLSNIGD